MSSRASRRSRLRNRSQRQAFPTSPSAAASRWVSSHCWEIFEQLARPAWRSSSKPTAAISTIPRPTDLGAAAFRCVQISVDGAIGGDARACATRLELCRGDRGHRATDRARIARRSSCSCPTRLNVHEALGVYELAIRLGCEAFVTGPLMRIGRAAGRVGSDRLQRGAMGEHGRCAARARARSHRAARAFRIYPWDILTEMRLRLEQPQAMLLIVPNGKVKLLNALPFAPADLRYHSLAQAWDAYRRAWRSVEVARFIAACSADPGLLRHANETWPVVGTAESMRRSDLRAI